MHPILKVLVRLWAWVRTGTATRLPAPVAAGVKSMDAVLEKRRQGADVTVADLEGCAMVHGRVHDLFAARNGTASNLHFREEDRATLFVLATKLAALQDPRHDAWPMLASLRAAAHPALRRRVVGRSDDWTILATICSALSVGDVECALTCLDRIRHDAFLLARVEEWAWEMGIGYAHANPGGHAARFLAAANLPAEPKASVQRPLAPARRWALSAIIYPSYARDQRADLTPSWNTAACRVMLADSWRVRSAEEARAVMSRLTQTGTGDAVRRDLAKLDGPRFTSDPRLDFIEDEREALERHGLLAWDLCRMMQVARTAYGAHLISEDETWWWLLNAARSLRCEYESWAEMARDYVLGTRFIDKRGAKEPYHASAAAWMCSSDVSPWRTIPWEIEIALLGEPEP